MLTTFQQERIKFHLDFLVAKGVLELDRDVKLLILSDELVLQIVGNIPTVLPSPLPSPTDPLVPNIVTVDGIRLVTYVGTVVATADSVLGSVERAFAKLGSDTIEDSLYVAKAGKVELRGNELQNRLRLYRTHVNYLAQLVGCSSPYGGRVGW